MMREILKYVGPIRPADHRGFKPHRDQERDVTVMKNPEPPLWARLDFGLFTRGLLPGGD